MPSVTSIAASCSGRPLVRKRVIPARVAGAKRRGSRQAAPQFAGNGRRRVDDGDARTGDRRDDRLDERVVGAAEHQGVGALFDERTDERGDELARLRGRQLAALDLFDQARTRLGEDPRAVGPCFGEPREPRAGDRLPRRQHADDAGLGGGGGRLDGRLNRDERQRPPRAQRLDGDARRRVARDDDRFHRLLEQRVDNVERALLNVFDRLVAIGRVRGVRDVDQVLGRQLPLDFEQHRHAADAGIEDADGRVAAYSMYAGAFGSFACVAMSCSIHSSAPVCLSSASTLARAARDWSALNSNVGRMPRARSSG